MFFRRNRSDKQRPDARQSAGDSEGSMVLRNGPSGMFARGGGGSSSSLRVSGSGPVKITHEVHLVRKTTITVDDEKHSSSRSGSRHSTSSNHSHRPANTSEYPSVYPPRGGSRVPLALEGSRTRSQAPQLTPIYMGPQLIPIGMSPPPPLSHSRSTFKSDRVYPVYEGPYPNRSHSSASSTETIARPGFATSRSYQPTHPGDSRDRDGMEHPQVSRSGPPSSMPPISKHYYGPCC